MFKSICAMLAGTIGMTALSGCASYPHRHHDEVIVESAGYRLGDREVIERRDGWDGNRHGERRDERRDDRHWD